MDKLRQLDERLKGFLFADMTIDQMNTDLGRYTQFQPLVNFEPTLYELQFVERYSLWKLFSIEKGYDFLSLGRMPSKEFDDFINQWVSTHQVEPPKEEIPR